MNVSNEEQRRAEVALEGRASAELSDLETRVWPYVADRIRQARLQLGLSENEVARRLGITIHSYGDLESHDDEAFTVVSLRNLAELGRILGVHPRVLLLGPEAAASKQTVSVEDLTAQLNRKILEAGLTADQIGDLIGWNIIPLLENPHSLWDDYTVEALYEICKAIGLDWVAALPDADKL